MQDPLIIIFQFDGYRIMPSCAWVKPSAIPLEFASEILSAIAAMLCCKVSAFVINLKLGAIKAGDFCFFV